MLQFLRLIQLNKEQLGRRSLEDLDFTRKQTDINELMVLDSISEACAAAIAGYPTTVRPCRGRVGGDATGASPASRLSAAAGGHIGISRASSRRHDALRPGYP